jgi:putative two-component system hydrogenase maturation factor HypX/HoxX
MLMKQRLIKQRDRKIDWDSDTTADILNKIHTADSASGYRVVETLFGEEYYLCVAHEDSILNGGHAGDIIAQRNGAICFATSDGAVWISHLKKKNPDPRQPSKNFKLPAAMLLQGQLKDVPESPADFLCPEGSKTGSKTFREIWYEESNMVGYLHFDFHNGAMSADQCIRLKEAWRYAVSRPTRVIVLMGGTDFWSNGIHLNIIEAAASPADESWRNINAINDLVLEIINMTSRLTVSALWGSAAAGGAIMSLAADKVWARAGCVVNPHYKVMGLFGSEYWTYLLPKRVGVGGALELAESMLALGMAEAKRIGLIDEILPDAYDDFTIAVKASAESLAHSVDYNRLVSAKKKTRKSDEAVKPLHAYREAELQKMHAQFYDANSAYHQLRHRFIHKIKPSETGVL